MINTVKSPKVFYALLAIAAILLIAATSCEYLEETTPATLLPTTDQIMQDARKYDQPPIEILERRYNLKSAQLKANHDRALETIEDRLAADTITTTQAQRKHNLIKLKYEQQQLELESLYRQRKIQLERERERFNR